MSGVPANYAGASFALLTKHGKERAIAPRFAEKLGAKFPASATNSTPRAKRPNSPSNSPVVHSDSAARDRSLRVRSVLVPSISK
jgi:hypothetical protein